ncbi:MAG TPA: methyltransferase [Gaiellaceae bacterium]|nr:methyltransferase [Gaiellaceae bacterium]
MSERPPEAVLWDVMRGSLTTKALAAVVDAGVPEALADGPRPVLELGGDPDTVHRLLRALASDGIFRETDPGVFEHTDESRHLLAPGWSEFAHLFGGIFFGATTDLEATTSEAPFPQRFGTGFWEWLAEHPDERGSFDAAMAGERLRPAERLAALEWRDGEVVVDVGGGNGALLDKLVELRPELRGIVLDLPETVRDEAALGDRIEFVPGSFFEAVPEGDAYVLSGILHDWPDGDAARILRTIRAAAPAHARLLINESVIKPGNGADGAKWLDLLMLVLAGGR